MTQTDVLQIIFDQARFIRQYAESERRMLLGLCAAGVVLFTGLLLWFYAPYAAEASLADRVLFYKWAIAGAVACWVPANLAYQISTKPYFLREIARLAELDYADSGFFRSGDVQNHKLFPLHRGSETQDGFQGRISGTTVSFQEFVFYRMTKKADTIGPGNPLLYYLSRYRCLVIRIPLHKKLYGHAILMPKNRIDAFLKGALSPFRRVGLVDPEFGALYDVLTTDQTEARYVINPVFMEILKTAYKSLLSKSIQISFQDQEILIVSEEKYRRDPFATGHILRPLAKSDIQRIAGRLNTIVKMTEALYPEKSLGF